jgi:hypothetical protein
MLLDLMDIQGESIAKTLNWGFQCRRRVRTAQQIGFDAWDSHRDFGSSSLLTRIRMKS